MQSIAGCFKTTLNYKSVSCDNQETTLSECVALPKSTSKHISFMILHCHPTTNDNETTPTGSHPIDQVTQLNLHPNGLMNDIADEEGALVVSPDYLGYGASKSYIHPYFAALHTARTCVDGLLAAIDHAKSRGYTFEKNCYTIIAGYSQGGSVALAVQRYLETIASDDVQKTVNLRESYCGAGIYDLPMTYDIMIGKEDMSYPGGVVWIMQGMIEAYRNGCMHGIRLQDMLTDDFNNSDLLDRLNRKNSDMHEMNTIIGNAIGNKDGKVTPEELMSADVLDPTTALARSLQKALGKNNITKDWTPSHPIYVYHFPDDEIVPYANTELIHNLWPDMVHQMPLSYSRSECKSSMTPIMIAFVDKDATHVGYAKRWYIYMYDGVLRKH